MYIFESVWIRGNPTFITELGKHDLKAGTTFCHTRTFTARWAEFVFVYYLQVLQVSFLRVTQQRGDPVVLPHAAGAAVLQQGKYLPDHRHAPQCTMGKLQDLCVADFLWRRDKVKETLLTSLCLLVCILTAGGWVFIVSREAGWGFGESQMLIVADFSSVVWRVFVFEPNAWWTKWSLFHLPC